MKNRVYVILYKFISIS